MIKRTILAKAGGKAGIMFVYIVLALVLVASKVVCGERIQVQECRGEICPTLESSASHYQDTLKYWCIMLDGVTIQKDVQVELSNQSRIEIIRELLMLEGDDRYSGDCSIVVHGYSSRTDFETLHSVQVEALYLIHMFSCKDPSSKYYAPVQQLIDRQTGVKESIGGEIVSNAFAVYKVWYQEYVRRVANDEEIPEADCRPLLRNSSIQWVWP